RAALAALVVALAAGAAAWQASAVPPAPGAAWWIYSTLLVLLFTWVATGFATALAGAWVLWRGDPFALDAALRRDGGAHAPIHRGARTAVVMPVCNEDIATVFGGLRATCESLAATGALALFDFYVLSDSTDPALRAAELRAWQELRATLGDGAAPGAGARLFYRWRRRRVKRKAGNVADFCRRWGRNYRYMVVLDADSTMHGDTLVALVRLMEANPRAGIVQTLPQPCGHGTLHARAQQFAHRVTGRLTSLGMAFWQLGDSHYWGHNAILRVEPFMRHCALAKLPGRGGLAGEILSHDFVEAALMARAGHEVWLAPSLGGSWEQNPPHLLDELQRDRRWCQGNLQNLRLVAEPGWRPAHRTMFAAAAFSYLAAPLWLLFVACGLVLGFAPGLAGAGHAGGSTGGTGGTGLWVATLALLVAPRALAVGAVWLRREQAAYGGTWRLAASAVVEMLLSALQAPLRALAHSAYVSSALTGLRLEWRSPARQADAVPWREACSRLGWLALPALALLAGGVPAWLVALPLLLAVPLVVAGARPALGARIERLGLLWNPEARRPPRTLARAGETRSLAWLVPSQVAAALAVPARAIRAPAAAPFIGSCGPWRRRRALLRGAGGDAAPRHRARSAGHCARAVRSPGRACRRRGRRPAGGAPGGAGRAAGALDRRRAAPARARGGAAGARAGTRGVRGDRGGRAGGVIAVGPPMRYRQFDPPADLAALLRCVWTFEGEFAVPHDEHIVPDGSPELIVHVGQPYAEPAEPAEPTEPTAMVAAACEGGASNGVCAGWIEQPRVLLAGNLTRPLRLRAHGRVGVLGLRLWPDAVGAFSALPAPATVDRRIAIDAARAALAARAAAGALSCADAAAAGRVARAVVQALRCRDTAAAAADTGRAAAPRDEAVARFVRRLFQARGQAVLDTEAAALGVSRRQFERRVRAATGLSPKALASVLRFRAVFDELQPGRRSPWLDAALASGFFDQAHMIRAFHRYAGKPPRHYLATAGVLSAALVAS
ncbi:MAG: glucans biosynthesis glucosyltransferase MdoH, partial [Rubrivivax sp.]|nr:glucans biosynthesis glucosyltransferase MdoH [Rubrivivax sp.]